jgi:hypothetical protein
LKEETPRRKKESPTSSFKPAEDTKAIRVDPECPNKVVRIGANLPPEVEAPLCGVSVQKLRRLCIVCMLFSTYPFFTWVFEMDFLVR